jgi:hypothetical protein
MTTFRKMQLTNLPKCSDNLMCVFVSCEERPVCIRGCEWKIVQAKCQCVDQRWSKVKVWEMSNIRTLRTLVFLFSLYRCCYIKVDSAKLHSKTVLAHIGAFPNKCTIKHPFTTATWKVWNFYKNYITLFFLGKKQLFDNIILTQNHAWHITQSSWNNYLV